MLHEVHTTEAFRYHCLLWRINGFKPPPRGSRWYTPFIVCALLLHLMATVLTPVTFIIHCCLSQSITEFCENLYITITDLNISLKFLNVYLKRHDLEKVQSILEDLDARACTPAERKALRDGIHSAKRYFVIFFWLIAVTVFSRQLVVIFSHERVLIYEAWLPWDWQSSRGAFLLANFYQFLSFCVQLTQNVCNDSYPQAYLRILASHIEALGMRIQALGEPKLANDNDSTAQEEQRAYEELIECIKDHQKIESLFLTIQKPISRTTLIQFVCTGLAQCTIGIYILYVGFDYTRMFHGTMFFVAITLETFVLCYFGETVCQEYLNLEKSIYTSNWMDQNQQFKRAFLLLLQRTQKTNIIMAGNILPVRLPTFVQILRIAYSAFTMLNEMK